MNEEKPTIFKHPYNSQVELERYKKNLEGIFFYTIDLLNGPMTSNFTHLENIKNKNIFINVNINERFTPKFRMLSRDYKITIESLKDIENLKSTIKERYLIIYYFVDPFEDIISKQSYIEKLTKLEQPKKFIYDFTKGEIVEATNDLKLSCFELYLLGYGVNEKDFFNYGIRPLLKNNFSKPGLEYLEKVYYNLKLVKYQRFNPKHTYKDESPEYKAIEILKEYSDIFYNNPNIKSYLDLINFRIKRIEQQLKKIKIILEPLENSFNSLINNTEMKFLKDYIARKENKSFKDIFQEDLQAYKYIEAWKESKEDLQAFKKENERIKYLTNTSDKLEQAYYLLIQSEPLKENEFISLSSLNYNNDLLAKIKEEGSHENLTSKALEPFFNPLFMYRNNALMDMEEQRKKGNVATYDNNIMNELVFSGLSFKELKQESKEIIEYNKIKEEIEQLNKKLKELKKEAFNPNIDYEENLSKAETLKSEKEQLIKKINDSEIIETEKGYLKAFINSTRTSKNFLNNVGNNSIDLIIEDFTRTYPKTFTIETLDKKTEKILTTHYINELTPQKAVKMNLLLKKIFQKGSQNPNDFIITLTIDEIGDLWNASNERRIKEDVRLFLTILSLTRLKSLKLKKGKNNEESLSNMAIISDFDISGKRISITQGTIIKKVYDSGNKSTIYTNPNIKYINPEEGLIYNKIESLLNQPNFDNEGNIIPYRIIKANSLISATPTLNASIDSSKLMRDLARPLNDYLNNLNNNEEANIILEGYNRLEYKDNLKEIQDTSIKATHKDGYIKNHQKQKEQNIKESIRRRKKPNKRIKKQEA